MAKTQKRNAAKPQETSADYAVAKVAGSIKEFGFRSPVTVDKDMVIVAGHTRVLEAKELGIKMVPVHVMKVSAARIRA